MFKKNTAVTGFPFHLVSKTDGSDITTGTPVGYYLLDGGTQTAIGDVTPAHEGNGQWTFDLLAAEMDGDIVGLTFTHASAITVHFTIKTDTKIVSELQDVAATDIVSSGAITTSSGRIDVGSWLGTAVTTSSTTNKPEVDAFSVSDDASAADRLELQFDGTGLVGDTFPLRQDQGASISGGLAVQETATSVTTIAGSEQGLANTSASNDTYWTGDDDGAGAEFIFRFVPSDTDASPGDLQFEGFYNEPGGPFTNSATLETYNFLNAQWDVQETLTNAAEDQVHDNQLSKANASPGSDTIEGVVVTIGDVLVKFQQTSQETGNAVLNIDRITIGFISSPVTASEIVDEWESQSQADPTGFHVNLQEWIGVAPLALSSQQVQTDMTAIHGSALAETSGQIAAAFVKLFDVATPTLVASDVMRGTDGALTDKAGFSLSTAGILAVWHQALSAIVTASSVGKLLKDEITAVRMATLTDWINAGRLDLLLDAIKAKTDGLNFTGNDVKATLDGEEVVTDSASRTASKADVSALALEGNVQGYADAALVANHLDHLFKTDYDPASKPGVATALLNELIVDNGSGVSQYAVIALAQAPSGSGGDATEAKQDAIIATLGVAGAGLTAAIGADGDTHKTLSDQLDGLAALSGEGAFTGVLTIDDGSTGLEGVVVNARRGGVLKASGTTDVNGQITNWVFGTFTYDLAARLPGYESATDTLTVSADAWTKTISLTGNTITAPPNASTTTGVMTVYDEEGSVEEGVTVTVQIQDGPGTDGIGYDSTEWAETSSALGVVEFAGIILGAEYKIWRGTSKPKAKTFTAPDSGVSFDLTEVIGRG